METVKKMSGYQGLGEREEQEEYRGFGGGRKLFCMILQ